MNNRNRLIFMHTSGKDSFTNEVPQKGLGPYTKEQNIKIANESVRSPTTKDVADKPSSGKNYQVSQI